MKIMQWRGLKILLLTAISILYCSISSHAQSSGYRLKTADSLFLAKRYTQSFELYESILKQDEYSSAMLLKMAFIQEGLDHIGQAMYYLNLYYIASRDKTALDKMEELATKYNLAGYKTSDADRILSFYHDHYLKISIGLSAILILMLSILFYTRVRLKQRPVLSIIFMGVFVLAFSYHLIRGDKVASAIITSQRAYLMEGPSAGASVIQVVGDGNRVEVVGKKDVWLKIRWDNVTGYVKENHLQKVEL
jgi:hypothetical protein